MARDRRVTVRLVPALAEAAEAQAREAGLADDRGDGVSTLMRECLERFGPKTARELAAEASSVPQEVRGSASPRRAAEPSARGAGSADIRGVPAQTFRCERDCKGLRPTSPKARCPNCGRSMSVPA